MTVNSLPISLLAAGMLLVVLACYVRAALALPFSLSLFLTLSFALACAALAIASWLNLADREFGQGVAQLGGAVLVAAVGIYAQRHSKPRAILVTAVVHRLASNDSKRFAFFAVLFLVALGLAPWLFHMGSIDRVLASMCFGALFSLIACFVESEAMQRAKLRNR